MKIIFTTVFSLLMFLSSFVLAQPYQKYDPLKGSTLVSTIGTSTMVELNYRDQISQMIFTVKENSKEKGLGPLVSQRHSVFIRAKIWVHMGMLVRSLPMTLN